MALARFAADFHAKFVHFAPKDGGEGEHAADTLVHEILSSANGVGSFGLSLASGEAIGVVAASESANTEMICGTELIVIVSEQGKEILILIVGPVEGSDGRHTVTGRKEGLAHGCS